MEWWRKYKHNAHVSKRLRAFMLPIVLIEWNNQKPEDYFITTDWTQKYNK